MAYESIPLGLRQAGKAIKEELFTKIHNNFEDHEARINALQIQAGSTILLNELIEAPEDTLPVGSIIWASASDANWQAELPPGEWMLCNGASVGGSDWAIMRGVTNLPDLRGRYLRMKDHSGGVTPEGDLALDAQLTDTYKEHNHPHELTIADHTHQFVADLDQGEHAHDFEIPANGSGVHVHEVPTVVGPSGGGVSGFLLTEDHTAATTNIQTLSDGDHGHDDMGSPLSTEVDDSLQLEAAQLLISGSIGDAGSSETRPKSLIENAFIKINRSYLKPSVRKFVIRVPYHMTITDVLLTSVESGASGSFMIDIKRGASPLAASTSTLSSQTSLAYDAASASGSPDPELAELPLGEFLVVSIEGVQEKMKSVHFYLAAGNQE